jgi:hypothetical protein
LSIYGGWVNAYEPVNKGKLGSSQEWRIEKPIKSYYWLCYNNNYILK